MFKIESYITPIILSYVEKYVKNIRPEDSQVSLWGGEVVFQNLDLKLDVLEEELALPFQFLSGHIHELAIRVPWTKIASEPIVITINTIEFVLKLQEPGNRAASRRDGNRKSKNSEEAPPPGYMASLINRIANNITIRCHNVILKYVEEDIVVSMNIQQLSMESADGKWQPAFIDISPTRISLRKLINVVDLTICLDKRNSAGKIEVCQEPVLYRSTLQARVLMKYSNVPTQDRASITRIDIHSKFLDFNVSSQQFPMLMRLFELGWALKQGRIKSEVALGQESGTEGEGEAGQESLLSWAWNLLPSFFPEENESDHTEDHEFHVFHAGCYVDRMRMIFKTQEFVGDSVVGTARKIKYNPFLQLDLDGVHGEVVICGLKWFNVCGGIARIGLQALEDCPCGQPLTVREIFHSDDPQLTREDHIKGSFFDDSSGEGRKYNVNWNYHLGTYSQDVLLEKSPALAMDIVHEVQIPDDRRTSEFGSDLEFSNLSEKYMIRAFLGKFRLKISADTLHRVKTLISYKDAYEYPPYYEEKPIPSLHQLPPPSAEDYDALMHEIPLKQVHITLLSPILELHPFDHGKFQLGRKRSSSKFAQSPQSPFLTAVFNRVECNILTPLYPSRLVFTTCQLPEPPSKLFDSCFHSISGNLERLQVKLHYNDSEIPVATAINLNHQHRFLIFPELWPNAELNKTEHNYGISDLKLVLNPPQSSTVYSILQTISTRTPFFHPSQDLLSNLTSATLPTLDLTISHAHLRQVLSERTSSLKLISRSLRCLSYTPSNSTTQRSLTALWPDHPTDEDFLTIIVQLPIDRHLTCPLDHPPLFYGRFLDLSLNVDPTLYEFLRILPDNLAACRNDPLSRTHGRHSLSPRKSVERMLPKPPKSSQPITSVHSNSDKVEGPNPAPLPPNLGSTVAEDDTEKEEPSVAGAISGPVELAGVEFWKQLSRKIIFHLEFRHCTVYFPERSIEQPDGVSGQRRHPPEEEFGDNEIVMLKLPLITINSAFKSTSLSAGINRFPISLAKSVWPDDRESFPWTVSLANTSSWTYQNRQMNKLLDETTTNISLVLNFKEDGTASSACFHVDTSPLKLNVFKEQLSLLSTTLNRILSLPMLQTRSDAGGKHREPQILEITQKSSSAATATDLKEFLDMTHNSSGASEETLKENGKKDALPVSIWLQWTFSKVTVNCIGKDDIGQLKIRLSIELEDIIYSLDKQDVYLQIKAKVGGMSGQCYEFDAEKGVWTKNEALALSVQTDSGGSSKSANDTFLNLTITKAETTNVHTKWDTVRKNREQNDTLIEVIMKVEQVDLRLDLDLLEQCADVLTIFQQKDETEVPRKVLGVRDLPLILFSSKGLRLFIPLRDCSEHCNAYIFKINSITMHHNVENPICRVPLRPDVYTKAAQMRILNVPGSKIEDRQYEILLKEISLSTACWSDILAYIQEQTSSTTHHDNPAFEWNNLQDVQRSTDFEVNTIFKEFNFSVIYAPCIIYKNVLICSQAMELNCMSDLLMDLDLDQLRLAGNISRKTSNILQTIAPPSQHSSSTRSSVIEFNPALFSSQLSQDTISFDSVRSLRDSELPRTRRSYSKLSRFEEDSGVESYRASDAKQTGSSSRRSAGGGSRQRKISSRSSEQLKSSLGPSVEEQVVPYEVCFLGGYFKVNLFDRKTNQPEDSKVLFRMVMAQPNGLLSLNLLERVVQLSLFDLIIELDGLSLLKTLSGEPDDLGIPQPIIKTRFVSSMAKKNNELSVEFKRPIKLTISHQKLKVLQDLADILAGAVGGTQRKDHPQRHARKLPKPILSRNKFKMIKSNMYDVEKVCVRLSQTMIHLLDEDQQAYNCKLSLSSIEATLRVQDRPARMSFNLDLEELIFCQGSFVIMHPFSFSLQATLTQEYWKRDPSIQVKLNSTYLQLDFNPNNLVEVQRMLDLLDGVLSTKSSKEGEHRTSMTGSANPTPSRENLIPLVTPGFSRRDSKGVQEEHYQDDLRAGAFQFIETSRSNELPLPYQIKIINRDVGIICWRYPQPRALYNVTVNPVPMNTSKPLRIQCKLEYFSEIYGDFFELCEFTLSENEKVALKLPSRKIASSIWRIVMTQNVIYEDGENDESGSEATDSTEQGKSLISNITDVLKDTYLSSGRIVSLPYRLHPKIFVACMRIDSMFNPNLIPNVECTVELRPVQINLFNVTNVTMDSKLPKPFEAYRLCKETIESRSHKFLMLNSNHLRVRTAIYDNFDVLISGELNLHCDLLDYSHYTFENVFELVNLKAIATIEEDALDLRTISDDILVRYGPSVGYNLVVAEKFWNSREDSVLMYGKYIVCNHTHVGLKFGQYQTGEAIFLGTHELCLYVFRSSRHEQQLQLVFNENTKDISTEPFSVPKEGLFYVKILPVFEEDVEDEKLFVVRIENLSSAQKRITIEGQINFFNMTSQRLKVQYRFYKVIPNSEKHYVSTSFQIGENSSANVFGAANNKNQQSIKISIDGEKKGWSGDIPMREIMNGSKPYLVKIPTTMTKEGYLSYWVRIIREKIGENVELKEAFNERVLVVVWPLFMVQSMLTVNTTAFEEKIDQTFSIYGQGERRQLVVSGTNSDEHELLFRMNFNALHGEDKRKALLSYRLIDGRSFFQVPERFKTVEAAIDMLQKNHTLNWPCSREDELRWKRENSIQEATLPLYHCSAAHELSCCLMLSIAPWCLFINQLGCQVRIKNCTTNETNIVEPNNILMPQYIELGFTLELDVGMQLESELIYISGDVKKQASNSVVLPMEGSVEINLRSDNGITNLILTSITENNIRVLILASQFVVTNYSSYDLRCWSFGVLTNERLDQVSQDDSGPHTACYSLPRNDRKCENPQGTAITVFNNLSKHRNKLKFNSCYNCYLTLYRHDGNEFSTPIYLNRTLSRKSLSVQCDDDRYLPLSLSIVAHQGQQYVSIYDDPCPSLSIENRTDFNIYVAQSDSVNANKAATAVPECVVESNFVWYQIVGSRQTVYYTPPALDAVFPETQEVELALIFACVSGSAIRWSHPVKIDENKNIFLNIPLYGDLKLAVNIKNRTTDILIDYISQDLEFSAKDIRTRLLNPIALPADQDSSELPQKPTPKPATSPTVTSADSLQSPLRSKRISFRGFFKSLNLTLFNDLEAKCCTKVDLISFNFDRVGVEMNTGGDNSKALVQFVSVQVDNELHSTGEYDFPVILCSEDHEAKQAKPVVIPNQYRLEECLEELAANALCSIYAEMDAERWTNVEGLRFKINPIRAYIEDTYINILLDYLMECLPMNLLYQPDRPVERIKCAPGQVLVPKLVTQQSSYLVDPIKFRYIRIEPLHVLLSVHTCMRLYIALDHSPLDFSAFERNHIRSLPIRFGNSLGMHYLSGAIFGGGWVIGSLEILGSPSGLARSVTSGLRDFVSLPVQGLFRGPWGFLVGLTQGSTSLVRNITAGTVNSVTKLATSVARNLDRLTLDTEHVQRTDALRRRRPQGMTEGFTQGLTGLGISILGAVGGLAHHPLQARSPMDVVTGVGKGIVGAFTKPISGAAELVALTGQGMLHSVGYNTMPTPKYFQQPLQRLEPIPYKTLWDPHALCDGSLMFTIHATFAGRSQYKLVVVGIYLKTFVLLDVDNSQLLEVLDLKTVYPSVDATDPTQVLLRIRPELPPPPTDYMSYPISSRTYQFVQESTLQLPKLSSYSLPPLLTKPSTLTPKVNLAPAPASNHGSTFASPPEENDDITSRNCDDIVVDIDDDGDRSLLDDVPIIEGDGSNRYADDNERRLVLYVDESLARYLVKYVNLLKKSQQPAGTVVFGPFDGK